MRIRFSEEIGCYCSRYERDRQMLANEKDGYKQDLMMASVYFQNENLDFVKHKFAVIRDLDLDVHMQFQRPKITLQSFLRQKYPLEDYSLKDRYGGYSFEPSGIDNEYD